MTSRIAATSPVLHDAQRAHEFEADTAGANHAHHGGGAKVVFPAVDRHVGELRRHLWQNRVQQHLHRRSPAARAASTGASSTCSMASAKNLLTMPTECRPRASTPGKAPNPTAATKMMPMISSGTDRRALSSTRATPNTRGAAPYCALQRRPPPARTPLRWPYRRCSSPRCRSRGESSFDSPKSLAAWPRLPG